jgi:hypothetical protein
MIYIIIAETFAIAALMYYAGKFYDDRNSLGTELSVQTETFIWAQKTMTDMRAEIDHLNDVMEATRQHHQAELRRREVLMDQQTLSLFAQIQAMAERLASLKLGTDPDPERVRDGVPEIPFDATPQALPYSQALFTFIKAIDSDEARTMVEDFVEMHRKDGMDDEQILDKLNRGEYDG